MGGWHDQESRPPQAHGWPPHPVLSEPEILPVREFTAVNREGVDDPRRHRPEPREEGCQGKGGIPVAIGREGSRKTIPTSCGKRYGPLPSWNGVNGRRTLRLLAGAMACGRARHHEGRARITVEWGYEIHSITLTARNWARVNAGKPLRIRGQGYWYEGEHFWDWWDFAGGYDGRLLVGYHQGTEWYGDGWDGTLKAAEIETFTGQEPDGPPVIEPVATWFIEHDLNNPEQGFRLRRMLYGGGAPPSIDVDLRAATLEELCRHIPPGLTRSTPPDITNTPVVETWRKLHTPAAV